MKYSLLFIILVYGSLYSMEKADVNQDTFGVNNVETLKKGDEQFEKQEEIVDDETGLKVRIKSLKAYKIMIALVRRVSQLRERKHSIEYIQ